MTEDRSKKVIDWELVEVHYRAGIRSLKDIGAEYGVSDAGIIKAARRFGWVRGAKTKIRQGGVPMPAPKVEADRAGFVYVAYIDSMDGRFYKVGKSVDFRGRIKSHQCSSPFEVMVAICYYAKNMSQEERDLHSIFGHKRIRGEWFRLSDDDLDAIAKRARLV